MTKLVLVFLLAAACTTGTGANLRVNDVRYAGAAAGERCDTRAAQCETATRLYARAPLR